MAKEKSSTTVSTKGQVVLPAAVRRRRNWSTGTRLMVEETAEGVLLKPQRPFPPTLPEAVYGCLPHPGPPKTLEEMDAGVSAEVRRRHARDRH